MDLKQLQDMIEKDSKIDQNNLDVEALSVPYLHAKYYNFFIEEVSYLKKLDASLSVLKKDKTEYYLGKSTSDTYKKKPLDLKILKQDLDTYLSADEDLIEMTTKIHSQKIKVDMLEAFLKNLTNRGFLIKSAIEFLKFKNGTF